MVKVLGASGSYSHTDEPTSFLIGKSIVIDAGNIVKGMGKECCNLEHIFITHTHFDHIVDLPFILESYFECRQKPLKIYAIASNLLILKNYIFNWDIWPNFEHVLNKDDNPCLELIPIEYHKTITIDDIDITPIPANHTIETSGFVVKKNNQSFLFSADTYFNAELIDMVNKDKSISSLLIDVSFPSDKEELAYKSKHLTPKLLNKMLSSLKRNDVMIYTYHHKPLYCTTLEEELSGMDLFKNGGKILETGDILDLFSPIETRKKVKNSELYYNDREYLKSLFYVLESVHHHANISETLDLIIDHTMKLTHADKALLYLKNDTTQDFECNILSNHTLNLHVNHLLDEQANSSEFSFVEDMKFGKDIVSLFHDNHKTSQIISNIYENNDTYLNDIKAFDKRTGYHSKSLMIVPLYAYHSKNIIGILYLINKKNIYSENIDFDHYDLESAKALSLQASISISNSHL